MSYLKNIDREYGAALARGGRAYLKHDPSVGRDPMRPCRRARIDKLARYWLRAKGLA